MSFYETLLWSQAVRMSPNSGPNADSNVDEIPAQVMLGQSLPLSALIEDAAGKTATVNEIASLVYTIFDVLTDAPVPGHANVSLPVGSVLSNLVQSDGYASNWNFRHQPSLALGQPFSHTGVFIVSYTFTPVAGNPFWCNFRVTAKL